MIDVNRDRVEPLGDRRRHEAKACLYVERLSRMPVLTKLDTDGRPAATVALYPVGLTVVSMNVNRAKPRCAPFFERRLRALLARELKLAAERDDPLDEKRGPVEELTRCRLRQRGWVARVAMNEDRHPLARAKELRARLERTDTLVPADATERGVIGDERTKRLVGVESRVSGRRHAFVGSIRVGPNS